MGQNRLVDAPFLFLCADFTIFTERSTTCNDCFSCQVYFYYFKNSNTANILVNQLTAKAVITGFKIS